jgi:hypothetical protein
LHVVGEQVGEEGSREMDTETTEEKETGNDVKIKQKK